MFYCYPVLLSLIMNHCIEDILLRLRKYDNVYYTNQALSVRYNVLNLF